MFGGVGPIADAIDDPRQKLMKKGARDHRLNIWCTLAVKLALEDISHGSHSFPRPQVNLYISSAVFYGHRKIEGPLWNTTESILHQYTAHI
jgi:hypothetical protein